MGYLPVFLNVTDADCLIVGGGRVALRKAATLLDAGARIHVISPECEPGFDDLIRLHPSRIELHGEEYSSRDLSIFRIVFATTNKESVNQEVANDAKRVGVWVNVADRPALCSVLAAATFQRGPLQVAIGTEGICPAFAAVLRDEFEQDCPDWIQAYLLALGEVRRFLQERCPSAELRQWILKRLSRKEIREQYSGLLAAELEATLMVQAEQYCQGLSVVEDDAGN